MAASTNTEQVYSDDHHRAGDDYNGVNGKAHQSMVSQINDLQFFRVANPSPFGLVSLSMTMFVFILSQCFHGIGLNLAFVSRAVLFGGVTQLIAGIMEFRVGNTFGTTAHCSYGAFWLTFAVLSDPNLVGVPEDELDTCRFSLGILLFFMFFLTLIFFIASLKSNIATLVVFSFLALTYLTLGIVQCIPPNHKLVAASVRRVSGSFGIVSAMAAFYTGSSGLMTEDTTWVKFPLGNLLHAPKRPKATTAV